MFPDTQAKTPKVIVIITDDPAAKPSIPSVRLAPFETDVTIKITKNIKTTILIDLFCSPFIVEKNE
jgi:TusA-related sulfurtransferase